ncbi:TetR/AcrR family transcriptional regulator [Leucobacter insecticola]|uniref:TetR/AcrR family transcriptional regulator n=1 Tax=Leucobacter insecticola TaxID=2714934 RepID=A0A6G8FGH8_9MICO|nr:TetR/AcrR family transcriptional regulator [Leucobacter insecticola]QIM15464.1 TetR/AcrR family transcriptional regulator [Leucobacter insecticola]
MTPHSEADQLLDAAEELFYENGYQSVGMDALRAAAGLPLKRIYSLFAGKEAISVAMLDRRDQRWHSALAADVDQETLPEKRVLAIFDWLSVWLASEGHRGCAWINAFGELGGTSPEVTEAVRRHKTRLRNYVNELVAETDAPRSVADAIFLLVEGCMVTAGISGNSGAATEAKIAAARLLDA